MKYLPVEKYITKAKSNHKTLISFAYDEDLNQMYAFYCARYENISFEDFMQLGFREFMMKLNSVPETEPLFNIIKSRSINLANIKNKDERKYWRELKRINAIPQIYLSTSEIYDNLKSQVRSSNLANTVNNNSNIMHIDK